MDPLKGPENGIISVSKAASRLLLAGLAAATHNASEAPLMI